VPGPQVITLITALDDKGSAWGLRDMDAKKSKRNKDRFRIIREGIGKAIAGNPANI
jgi:hypothetical protein